MRLRGLAEVMAKVAGVELQRAMAKAASTAMPRAPSLSDAKATKPTLPKYTAPAPQAERTRPEAIAPQKSIAPPAI